MSVPTSGEYDDEWSGQTANRPGVQSQYLAKRRRTESYGLSTQEIGLMRDGGEPGVPRFIGSGSGIHFIRTVYDALARSVGGGSARSREGVATQLVPGEDDQLVEHAPGAFGTPGTRARAPFWKQSEIIQDIEMRPRNVSFDTLVDCTRSYFDNWHPAFPFLHGPEVLDIFEQVGSQGISSLSEADATIVRAIVSISLADSRQLSIHQNAIPAELVFLSQEDVASRLVFVVGCPASLKTLQAAVAAMLFLISLLKFNQASRLSGVIVRMAFHLGLHRCPYRYPNFSPQEASMRKRLWWSLYCLDRMVCQSLGLPLDIRDDDVDVCYIDVERHKMIPGFRPIKDISEAHQLQLLTLLSKHSRLRGMILELRNKNLKVRHDTLDRSLLVQAQLAKWVNEVHDATELSMAYADEALDEPATEESGDLFSVHHKTLLNILQYESVITLNRPLLASNPATPASQAALQTCISASRSVIDTIRNSQSLKNRTETDSQKSLHDIMVWPLLTWSVWMSCFILAYAALEGVTTVLSAQRYAKKALHILKHLSRRGTKWPDSCVNAVEHIIIALEKEEEDTGKPPDDRRSRMTPRVGMQYVHSPNSENHYERTRSHHTISTTTVTPGLNDVTPNPPNNSNRIEQAPLFGTSRNYYMNSRERETQNQSQETPMSQTEHIANSTNQPDVEMTRISLGMPDFQDQWLDPLNALDFSNFAQAGTSDSAIGLGFY